MYSTECGDESGVLTMHAGNGDLGDLGARFLACFVAALDDARLPEDTRFRETMTAYMRQAVERVLAYGHVEGAEPGLPMPRWGWDGPESWKNSPPSPVL